MDLLTRASDDTARMDTHEVAAYLLERLGPTLTAYIAGSRSRAMPKRWATPPGVAGHAQPSAEKAKLLQVAHSIFRAVEAVDSEHVARNWLIAANPRLDGATVAEEIREGRIAEAYRATRSFVDDSYYA